MNVPTPPTQRGYTMVEFMVVTMLVALALATMTPVFDSTSKMSQQSRVSMRASSEHRRNLNAIANVLRAADIATLSGFDHEGVARTPTFSRVTGVDLEDRTYGGSESLVWRPRPEENGLKGLGDVWLVSQAGAEKLAARVPQNGFAVHQAGSTLVIRLSSYYSTSANFTELITGETAISLRN